MADVAGGQLQRLCQAQCAGAIALQQMISHALCGPWSDARQAAQGHDQFIQMGRRHQSGMHQNGNFIPGGKPILPVKLPIRCCEMASAFFIASLSASTIRSSSISLSSDNTLSSSDTRRTSCAQVIVTLTKPEAAWPSTSTVANSACAFFMFCCICCACFIKPPNPPFIIILFSSIYPKNGSATDEHGLTQIKQCA